MDPLHSIDNLEIVNKVLCKEFPRSFLVQNWINTRLKWIKLVPSNVFFICCPYGNIEDGLVTFGKTGGRVYYLTIFHFKDDLTSLTSALLNTRRIEWSEKMVCGVPSGKQEWFSSILQALGYAVHHDTPTHYYRLPKEDPLGFDIKYPEGVYVAPLNQTNIPKINSLWQHRFEGSENLLSECIRLNYGLGIFSKQDHQLLSWVIKYEYSDLAILQTDERYRRRGFGKLVVKAICKKVAEDGEDILLFIVPGNTASENLCKDLGFTYAGSYNWLEYDLKTL